MQEKKAAIYHYTDGSTKRPKIYENHLQDLCQYAAAQGFIVTDIFCDKSLQKNKHTEFNRFIANCADYDVLVTEDFHHICKNTMQCIKTMKELSAQGISVYSKKDGIFTFQQPPLDISLKVATYNCRFGPPNDLKQIIAVQNDIFKLFVKQKTNWTIIDQFTDESESQNNGEQTNLQKLISNRRNYDLLLVHNLNDVHWRTSNFCKTRESLKLDIYSLQDGFLKYNK